MSKVSYFEIELLKFLGQGQLAQAREVLTTWEAETPSDRLLFGQAKAALYEGNYRQAQSLLLSYLKNQPNDLAARCDLLLCYYQLGERSLFKEHLQQALTSFQSQVNALRDSSEIDVAIFLSKMLEENANHEIALKILALPLAEGLSEKQRVSIKVQKLRLHLELQDFKKARALYEEILQGKDHNLNFEIEREHALMLADAQFLCLEEAWDRFRYSLQQNLTRPDWHFLSSEICEQIILKKKFLLLKDLSLDADNQSIYERQQALLVHSYLHPQKDSVFLVTELEKTLPPLLLLRLLRQALLLFPESPQAESWVRRYKFHVQNLPCKPLQDVFLNPIYEKTASENLLVNVQRRTLFIQDRLVEFKSPLFWKLLKLFSNGAHELDVDVAIKAIYEEIPNAHHFDRLRIAIYRLNTSLEQVTHIKSAFQITKAKVTLLISIRENS